MHGIIRKIFTSIAIGVALLAVPAAIPATVSAFDTDVARCLLVGSWFGVNCDDPVPAQSTGLEDIVVRLVNLFSLIIAIVAVIMIIFGGFRYITSGGESSQVTGAKNTIIYAIVGLIVVALAQLIVRFVVENVTGI